MFNVYIISSEINGEKLHKIGFTRRTVEKRLDEFRTGNASDLKIVDVFVSKWGTKIEAYLHKYFLHKKVGGEWFNLNEDDLVNFGILCQQLDENFNIIEKNNTYYIDRGDRF